MRQSRQSSISFVFYLLFSYTAHNNNIVKYCNGSVYNTRKSFKKGKSKKNDYHPCLNVKKKHNFIDGKCSSNKRNDRDGDKYTPFLNFSVLKAYPNWKLINRFKGGRVVNEGY